MSVDLDVVGVMAAYLLVVFVCVLKNMKILSTHFC